MIGRLHRRALLFEQLDAEITLQKADLMADRRLADIEGLGGAREAAQTIARLEGAQGSKRRKIAHYMIDLIDDFMKLLCVRKRRLQLHNAAHELVRKGAGST